MCIELYVFGVECKGGCYGVVVVDVVGCDDWYVDF